MIIGITGTLGAGKGTVAKYLVEKKGFTHYSVRAFLRGEIEKRDLPLTRDSMVMVANELRATHSPRYIIEALLTQAKERGGNAVIESIRAVGEAEALKEAGAILLSVDAKQEVRYQRIVARKSETDDISFETFLAEEKREMDSSDPTKQNIAEVMRMTDIHIENNGTLETLFAQTEEKVNV